METPAVRRNAGGFSFFGMSQPLPVFWHDWGVGDPLKILFVCSQNRWRSLTAEKMYQGFSGYQVRSAGTEQNARIRVNEGHIGWADLIFVMEKRHKERLREKFPAAVADKQVICLHIDDNYQFMDVPLQEVLREKLKAYIEVP
jgi:predicted protein tyrosine phosphatase